MRHFVLFTIVFAVVSTPVYAADFLHPASGSAVARACPSMQFKDGCSFTPTTAPETSGAVDIRGCPKVTIRQTVANTIEIEVSQGGDFFTPPGHTITTLDGFGNLGFNEQWESFRVKVTTFVGGVVYATCK